jgi:hypothetical protein
MDLLTVPWSGTPLRAPVRPTPTSFAGLPAPVAGRRSPGRPGADLLACPWSGTRLILRRLPAITGLPTLAPSLPAPRTAHVQVLSSAQH